MVDEQEREVNHSKTEVDITSVSSSPSTTSGLQKLNLAVELIISLTSLSHKVKVFSAKWLMVRTKLAELNTGLIATGSCQALEQNQPLSDLVEAISETVGGCVNLVHRCINVSYSGKLLMQSELDLAISKLDAHIRSLSGVYAVGVHLNGFAIVVSRPGPNASRDDMRFYVSDLETRMKIGDVEMKRQALMAVNEIVKEDEKYVRVVVESSEIVGLVIRFLDSSEDDQIRYESVRILAVICGFDSYKGALVVGGIIPPLIRVVDSGGEVDAKVAAINCLMKLTENSDNAWSISAHGGVSSLLNLCFNEEGDKSRSEMMTPACSVLKNIITVEEIKRFIVEEGAVKGFIKLVRAKDEVSQVNAIEFLQSLADDDESTRQIIVKEGIIPAITRVLNPRSLNSGTKSREAAMRAAETICFPGEESLSTLISHGFMDSLLYYLRRGEVGIQELSLKVAVKLSRTTEEVRKKMGEVGLMWEFVKFMEGDRKKKCEVRAAAVEGVAGILTVGKNRRRFVQDERSAGVVEMIGDGGDDERSREVEELVLRIVVEMAKCGVGRRRIATSGKLKWIEKMAECGVADAQKIVRKMASANRLQSMVRKLLHS